MKVMRCPLYGDLNIQEFAYLGPVRHAPQRDVSDDVWAKFIFNVPNPAGLIREWWCHIPTGCVFIAERNTITDEIIKTYAPAIAAEQHDTRASTTGR